MKGFPVVLGHGLGGILVADREPAEWIRVAAGLSRLPAEKNDLDLVTGMKREVQETQLAFPFDLGCCFVGLHGGSLAEPLPIAHSPTIRS